MYDASLSAPRQIVYSSTAPGPASGRRGATDGSASAVTGDYDEPVPVDYAEASDPPSGLLVQVHDGGAAVNLDRDMYVSNGPAVDDVDSYELPMLPAVLPPASNNGNAPVVSNKVGRMHH